MVLGGGFRIWWGMKRSRVGSSIALFLGWTSIHSSPHPPLPEENGATTQVGLKDERSRSDLTPAWYNPVGAWLISRCKPVAIQACDRRDAEALSASMAMSLFSSRFIQSGTVVVSCCFTGSTQGYPGAFHLRSQSVSSRLTQSGTLQA
jgi:hypothetical protein